jgi:hypothetical protein
VFHKTHVSFYSRRVLSSAEVALSAMPDSCSPKIVRVGEKPFAALLGQPNVGPAKEAVFEGFYEAVVPAFIVSVEPEPAYQVGIGINDVEMRERAIKIVDHSPGFRAFARDSDFLGLAGDISGFTSKLPSPSSESTFLYHEPEPIWVGEHDLRQRHLFASEFAEIDHCPFNCCHNVLKDYELIESSNPSMRRDL